MRPAASYACVFQCVAVSVDAHSVVEDTSFPKSDMVLTARRSIVFVDDAPHHVSVFYMHYYKADILAQFQPFDMYSFQSSNPSDYPGYDQASFTALPPTSLRPNDIVYVQFFMFRNYRPSAASDVAVSWDFCYRLKKVVKLVDFQSILRPKTKRESSPPRSIKRPRVQSNASCQYGIYTLTS